ncbi:TlpA disulfide reductase family protein [uncultured Chryseobacterium sp.]|uniref:TlpA family protein disulfide reductase n=1 Tax=uncultured Chryseobacterium sp. TaxID=259322 RepID=UPI002586ED84|nr:TlpA disulfide reductase family protein [uncultured Chryseobacterium sp.]
MKNFILTIIICLCSISVFAQNKTNIRINIPQVDTTELKAVLYIEDPLKPLGSGILKDTALIKNNQCHFTFDIENPSNLTIIINNKFITFPGDYSVIIEPGDNLRFTIPSIKEAGFFGWGIMKIKIDGEGSEKINFTKNVINKYFEIYAKDPNISKQSLTYQFESTDKKLDVIDSMYKLDTTVPQSIKDIIKAQLYNSVMTSLIRSSNNSRSDSLRFLFKKYIVNKKRMAVFFKKNIVQYGGTIGSYLILSEYPNPITVGGNNFTEDNRMKYAEIIVKHLKKFPEVRDYMLSKHLIASIRTAFDSTTTKLYEYYCDKADFNNPNFNTVANLYQDTENKFAVGKPFFNFSLPDSTGKIYNLSDFKGKVMVIDFWYNGCGGCRLLVPALEEVEKEMVGKNVQFLSIGIDKKDLWLDGIGKYSSKSSIQLFTNGQSKEHPMMKYLNIYAYPRLFIVDKSGNITPAPPNPISDKNAFINSIKKYL